MRKSLGLIALLLVGCPVENTGTQQATPPPTPATQAAPPPAAPATQTVTTEGGADVAAGKRLYLTACANCHGPDGTGAMMKQVLPKIGDLGSPEMHGRLKDEDIINLVKTGRDKMPAFGTMFGDDQLKSLVAYVRTMKRAQ
jgi:mono/diheme cytochrome c family protein